MGKPPSSKKSADDASYPFFVVRLGEEAKVRYVICQVVGELEPGDTLITSGEVERYIRENPLQAAPLPQIKLGKMFWAGPVDN